MTTTGPRTTGPILEDHRALLAAIVDATEQAVVSVDLDGVVTSWNRGAEDLYGWTAAEMVGRPYEVVLADGAASVSVIEEVVAGESVAGVEARRIRRDGSTVMVGETTAPVRDAGGAVIGVAMIARDITDRLGTEALLEHYRRELDIRNRHLERSNTDLEQFAYVASHDLSEPLRAVAGMVGLLARRYQGRLDADADEFIDFAVDGCERMRTMISDLLAYSRAGRAELAVGDVALADLVDQAVVALGAQVEEAGAVVDHAGLPTVRGDRTQLIRVVQNLLSNAVKFRRPGQPVRVEVSARRQDGDDGWRIEVADDGIGIEEQYRERIFRMFQRLHTSDQHPGSGIGLSITERIVAQHGGSIGVGTNDWGGSTFWFTLPDRSEAR
ncbi:ATP-binding protein [Acidimicrobiia bacterium EGI L10123]|uniref:sensor histidine kinase n=1 Tax=Salinilacustrithrix flava TaxID=2957203 RepID=UPI003D7C2005|nr:ATP-binding protein [Acidimicrobiia bacterium EGI L10123]